MRYTGGVTGYLEVLTNETNAFSAELGLAQAQLNELLALVTAVPSIRRGLAAIESSRISTATECEAANARQAVKYENAEHRTPGLLSDGEDTFELVGCE